MDSLPLAVDSGVKEESDLTASASSSSLRLSNLSSSSRRFRHVSPPPPIRLDSQKKTLGTSQSQLTPYRPAYPEVFHNTLTLSALSSSVSPSIEVHLTSPQTPTAVTQVYKVIRGSTCVWKWICFGYFCIAIFHKLKHIAANWPNSQPLEIKGILNDPESILSTLPVEHRLSKLSSLYPVPLSLKPFLLGPREQVDSVAACMWTDESGLSLIQEWASSWSGPISLLVTHSAPPSSTAYMELYTRLVSLSQILPNISFHVQQTSSSLRNYNAFINIARLFSPSSKVLLFPPSALTIWGSLPRSSAFFLNKTRETHGQFIIPLSPLALTNISSADMSRSALFPTSALLLDKGNTSWCTERLFTIMKETKGEPNQHLASNIEMGFHWRECIWNIWLRSHGRIQLLDEGWGDSGTPSLSLQFDALPETVESNLRARLARKQRSETCFLVAREMVALGEWIVEPSTFGASGEIGGDPGDSEAKQAQTESTKAKWMRGICRETLERWGKELILD